MAEALNQESFRKRRRINLATHFCKKVHPVTPPPCSFLSYIMRFLSRLFRLCFHLVLPTVFGVRLRALLWRLAGILLLRGFEYLFFNLPFKIVHLICILYSFNILSLQSLLRPTTMGMTSFPSIPNDTFTPLLQRFEQQGQGLTSETCAPFHLVSAARSLPQALNAHCSRSNFDPDFVASLFSRTPSH